MSKVTRWRALAAGLAVLAATSCGGRHPRRRSADAGRRRSAGRGVPRPGRRADRLVPRGRVRRLLPDARRQPAVRHERQEGDRPARRRRRAHGRRARDPLRRAATGFQQVSAQLYADKAITLGLVSTDEAIQNSTELPTVAVAAPLETSPQMIMWDRTKHPDVHTIADLGRTASRCSTTRPTPTCSTCWRRAAARGPGRRQLRRQPVAVGDLRRRRRRGGLRHVRALHLQERAGRRPQLRRRPAARRGHGLPDVRAGAVGPRRRQGRAGPVPGEARPDRAARPGGVPDRSGAHQRRDRLGGAGRRRFRLELLPRARRLRGTRHAGARHRGQRPGRHAGQLRHRTGRAHDRDPRAGVRGPEQADQGRAGARPAGDERVRRPVDRAAAS